MTIDSDLLKAFLAGKRMNGKYADRYYDLPAIKDILKNNLSYNKINKDIDEIMAHITYSEELDKDNEGIISANNKTHACDYKIIRGIYSNGIWAHEINEIIDIMNLLASRASCSTEMADKCISKEYKIIGYQIGKLKVESKDEMQDMPYGGYQSVIHLKFQLPIKVKYEKSIPQ